MWWEAMKDWKAAVRTFSKPRMWWEAEFYPKKTSHSKAYQVKNPFLPYKFDLAITV